MSKKNKNNPAMPLPDPLGFAQSVTDGAVQDPFRIAAENMSELNRQAAIASAERQSDRSQPEQERSTSESTQRRETKSRRVVRRGTGETVQTIL